ncbi:unnamed protein product [Plutella xylostella]|uniref:(diamondback moth) hypothetical protein n=1 Tax=Plutella xylostella TaxID=51655 RepID=A0A8S4FTP2_PLUXY|nr:unnamed protein product [Plutella xylostella]
MGFHEGRIFLDSESGIYNPGQTIFGKLEFVQGKVKTFRGIYVRVKGFAHVHWTTSHTRRHNDKTEHYTVSHTGHQEFFRVKQYLIGGEKGEIELQPDKYSLPFQCHIPAHCPSSYEGTHGHIRYEVKVVVDRAFKIDQEKEIRFQVDAPLDLNTMPQLREPINFEMVDSYCCFCMNSGSSNTVVKVPVSGFAPGDAVPIEVECTNKGDVEIDSIKLKLVKKTTFTATDHPDTKHEETTIAEAAKGPCPGDSTKSWLVTLEVPLMDINNVKACSVIDVDYVFEVKVNPSGCHSSSEEEASVTLGTTSLLRDAPEVPEQNMPQNAFPGQTLGLSPYPGGNVPYPAGDNPYPVGNTPYPVGNSPYPTGNVPYPPGNVPYPPGNMPYPAGNGPYPANMPQPAVNVPYPGGNAPYPGGNISYPGGNGPYPPGNGPYPGAPSPYPPPYPGGHLQMPEPADVKKSPIMGFRSEESAPLIPCDNPPQVNPYASASAPAIPNDNTTNPTVPETPTAPTPYNPEFMDKK